MIQVNEPYVKKMDENGIILNPISKNKPYLNRYENRSQRRYSGGREISNGKGCGLVVTYLGKGKFEKTFKKRRLDGSVYYIIK